MNKKINLTDFQREIDVAVVKSTLTIIDRRTGRIGTKEFYRVGLKFPYDQVARKLSEYGYDIVGHADEEVREGVMDLELMFASMAVEVEEEA